MNSTEKPTGGRDDDIAECLRRYRSESHATACGPNGSPVRSGGRAGRPMKLLMTIAVIVAALLIMQISNRWARRARRAAGMYPPPGEGTDEHVRELLRAGRKLSAIKLYREIHGVGPAEAKAAVDDMATRIRRGE